MMSRILFAGLVALARSQGSCGGDSPSQVEDCQNVDFGSCGNACCRLEFQAPAGQSTDSVMQALNASFTSRGPDGAYTPQMTAEGTLGFGDLKQFGSPMGVDWIGQVFHTSPHPYTDTINFNIRNTEGGVVVKAFSISQIGGALGDNGQNYKNIVNLLKAAFGNFNDFQLRRLDESCPGSAVVA
jgi:hypothetical protein